MKKVFTLFVAAVFSVGAYGQTIPNAGMESWRTSTAGFPPTPIAAPSQWFGYDSLVLSLGPFAIGGSEWNRQVYQETSFVHSGSSSAKIMTALEGDLGFFSGIMGNAKAVVDLGALGSGDVMDAVSFEGGTATDLQIMTVSAWVAYHPGIDPVTDTIGSDVGLLTVNAIATIGGADSVVGAGFVNITPSDIFVEVTANLTYSTTLYPVHTVRFLFFSSADPTAALDSSTLYVDDVSMTGVPNPPPPPPAGILTASGGSTLSVYPNPASGLLNFDCPLNAGYTCTLLTTSGRAAASMVVGASRSMNVSALPAGLYFYRITNRDGKTEGQGVVNIRN